MAVMRERRRFTLEEYHRMGEAGILVEDEHVELVGGEIVEMTPIGRVHASVVARLTKILGTHAADRAIVWVQNPLSLPRAGSEFQPDVVLLRPRADFYRAKRPEAEDALLVVEVMDSSVQYDRRVKLPIYAGADVLEVWLVDIDTSAIETYREPTASGYRDRRVVGRDGSLAPLAFPDVSLPVREVLG